MPFERLRKAHETRTRYLAARGIANDCAVKRVSDCASLIERAFKISKPAKHAEAFAFALDKDFGGTNVEVAWRHHGTLDCDAVKKIEAACDAASVILRMHEVFSKYSTFDFLGRLVDEWGMSRSFCARTRHYRS